MKSREMCEKAEEEDHVCAGKGQCKLTGIERQLPQCPGISGTLSYTSCFSQAGHSYLRVQRDL